MKSADVRKVAAELLKLEPDTEVAARLCVAGYVTLKKIAVHRASRLARIVSGLDPGAVMQTADIILSLTSKPVLEDLVGLFELLVPVHERKKNGVAYTPLCVKDMMLRRVLAGGKPPTVYDPTCGCGSFLISAANLIHELFKIPYRQIASECLFGSDVSRDAITRAEMLFAVLLSEHDEDDGVLPNLYCIDMLKPESIALILNEHRGGFTCVVGNPPYVRFRNLNRTTQRAVGLWKCADNGNADLYMPFFEIGWQAVAPGGALAFITSNTYLQSVNGRALRGWMSSSGVTVEITDFRDVQLFDNVTCYTCVSVLYRSDDACIRYRRVKKPNDDGAFTTYAYAAFDGGRPWRMRDAEVDLVVSKLENCGRPLREYVIRNGLATLANDVFFFKPEKEEGNYYIRRFNGRLWRIEKSLCRDIAKPNVIHSDRDLQSRLEKAIFPYNSTDKGFKIKSETEMKRDFPQAYAFLLSVRNLLDGRDKGEGEYPAWYAYGRTQGMNCRGCKLLIPYIAGAPTAVLATDPNLLFYCGYALIDDDVEELRLVRKFMESDAFWYYLYHTSKPYSKGYMALAKNYIVGFSIPRLSAADRQALMRISSRRDLNARIWQLYGFDNAVPDVPVQVECGADRGNHDCRSPQRRSVLLRATGTDDAVPSYEQMMLLKKKKPRLVRKAAARR